MTDPPRTSLITFEQGSIICRQGTLADAMYVLKKGKVAVVVNPEGKRPPSISDIMEHGIQISVIAQEGSLFGESANLTGPRSASIIAMSHCEVEQIPLQANGLQRAIEHNTDLGIRLARTVARRLLDIMDGVSLLTNILDDIQRDINGHFLDYYQLSEKIGSRAYEILEAGQIYQWARTSYSYRKARQLLTGREETSRFLDAIASMPEGNVIKLSKHEALYRDGDTGGAFFIVRQGELEIRLNGRVIAHVQQGEIVGVLQALLPDCPARNTRVIATRFSVLARFPIETFVPLVNKHPFLIVHTVKILSERINRGNQLVCDFQKTANRLIDILDGQDQSCGKDTTMMHGKLRKVGNILEQEYLEAGRQLHRIASSAAHLKERAATPQILRSRVVSYRHAHYIVKLNDIAENLERIHADIQHAVRPRIDSAALESLASKLVEATTALSDVEATCELKTSSIACHSVRVGVYALTVARQMHDSPEQIMDLAMGSLLHDIGMLGITQREIDDGVMSIEDHVGFLAEQLMANLPWLAATHRAAILQHHETMDQRGYPNRPPPEEILMSARIIAPCNDFDLLWQGGTPSREAAGRILEHPGRYDPKVLDGFQRLLDDILKE